MIQPKKRKGRPKKSEIQKLKTQVHDNEIIVKLAIGKTDVSKIKNLKNLTISKTKNSDKLNSEYCITLKSELDKKDEALKKLRAEFDEAMVNVNKYIGEKTKFVELKAPIIHKDGNISAIEKNNDLVCFYCTYSFDNDPCFIPEKYDKLKKVYHVFGNFCSFSCASRYNLSLGDFNVWNRNSLLVALFRESIRNTGLPEDFDISIPSCPPKETLIKFGGYLTIDEFRKSSLKGDKVYNYIPPYMEMKKSYIEELHKKAELFDSLAVIKNQLSMIMKPAKGKGRTKKQLT